MVQHFTKEEILIKKDENSEQRKEKLGRKEIEIVKYYDKYAKVRQINK